MTCSSLFFGKKKAHHIEWAKFGVNEHLLLYSPQYLICYNLLYSIHIILSIFNIENL